MLNLSFYEPETTTIKGFSMANLSFSAIVSAGRIKAGDDFICSIQNLSKRDIQVIAAWLSLATGDDVQLIYMDSFERAEIKAKYVEELAELERMRIEYRLTNKLS